MTKKIVIRKRLDDYMAFIEGHPEIWSCGKTVNFAIGDLILSHQVAFDVAILFI